MEPSRSLVLLAGCKQRSPLLSQNTYLLTSYTLLMSQRWPMPSLQQLSGPKNISVYLGGFSIPSLLTKKAQYWLIHEDGFREGEKNP